MRHCKCGTILETKAPQCKPCAREYIRTRNQKRRADGLPAHEVYNYRWRFNNPQAYLLMNAKARAKKKGWDFDLTAEDIEIPKVCPILGIPLFIRLKGEEERKNPNNPSLDRIDSNKGYVKGNVRVISWRANNLKADGTLEEFKKLVENWNG